MTKIEFDAILKQVGECGKYQIVLYILLGLVGIPTGWQNLAMVFIGGYQEHWCADGTNYLNGTDMVDVSFNNEDKQTRQCYVYAPNETMYASETGSDIFFFENDQNETLPYSKCKSWVYDTSKYSSTIRSQWDLVCDHEYLVAMATTIYMAGFLTGAILFGSISDLIGRKKTLLICVFTELISALAAAVASRYGHYAMFVILRFFVGNCAGGSFTVAFVVVMEIVGGPWRMYLGIFVQGWFALGFLSEPLIAYFLRDHFELQLALALPVVWFLTYYWLLPESPRWLFAENRSQDAEPIIRKMAKWNKKPVPKLLSSIESSADPHHEKATLVAIFRRPRMRMRLFITFFVWFVNSLVYYGISYNADKMGGSVYVNAAINAAVELPAYVVTCLLLNKVGRRWMLVASMIGGGAALISLIPVLLYPDLQWLVVILANIGKFGISASFAIIYVFTAELFPTVVRNAAVGSGSMCARIGGLMAPQLVRLDTVVWFGFPALLMGVTSVAGGLLSLLLPETTGERLPETLQDGEDFGTKKYKEAHQTNGDITTSNSEKLLMENDTNRFNIPNNIDLEVGSNLVKMNVDEQTNPTFTV